MKCCILVTILSVLSFVTVCAQKQIVTGRVFSAEGQAEDTLPYAEVTILALPDSALVKGTVSKYDGYFKIGYMRKPHTSYLLRASFLGYIPFTISLTSRKDSIDLGNIRLEDDAMKLDEVTIKADMRPVVQKRDSTIYNVAAYKVPEDEYLEALIKRIPGLDYDPDTKVIKFNGYLINGILINGQDLFGGDKKLALTNLPIGIIKRVKVYDRRTEEERATGVRRSNRKNYVLDLETKSEKNGMLMAEAEVGVGTARKKNFSGNIMQFDPKKGNVMLVGKCTNRYMDSDYPGNINRDLTGTISRQRGEKLNISVNGNYSYTRSGNLSTSRNELYRTSENQYDISEDDNSSKSHVAGGGIQVMWRPDSLTTVQVNVSGNMSGSKNSETRRSASFDAMPAVDITSPFAAFGQIASDSRINYSDNKQFDKRRNVMFNVFGSIVRKTAWRGDNINISVSASRNTSSSDSYRDVSTCYYRLKNSTGVDSTDWRMQYIGSPASTLDYGIRLSYTFVLKQQHFLQLGYGITRSREKQDGDTYDLSAFASSEASFGYLHDGYERHEIDSLRSRNRSLILQHCLSAGYDYNKGNASLSARMEVMSGWRSIQSQTGKYLADTAAVQTIWMPSVSFNYTPDNYFIQLAYTGYTQLPELKNLVSATDYSSPLNITHSNPELKMAYAHMVNFMFNAVQKGILADFSFNQTFNAMSQATLYNSQTGGCETYPMNVNGNWGISGHASYEKRFGQFRAYVSGGSSFDNNVALTSGSSKKEDVEKTNTHSFTLTANLRTAYMPQWGDVNVSAFWSFLCSDNSLQGTKSYSRTYRMNAEANVNLPLGLGFRSDARYALRSGTGIGRENRNEVVWNMGIWWKFLKGKKARLEVEWIDILNQDKDYSSSASATGFYESYQRRIGSYIMSSFSYKF